MRHLKTTMRMDVLKCKTVDGVLKELAVYAPVYNLVRVVMLEAARRQGRDVERISFVDAMRWLAGSEGDAQCAEEERLILDVAHATGSDLAGLGDGIAGSAAHAVGG